MAIITVKNYKMHAVLHFIINNNNKLLPYIHPKHIHKHFSDSFPGLSGTTSLPGNLEVYLNS